MPVELYDLDYIKDLTVWQEAPHASNCVYTATTFINTGVGTLLIDRIDLVPKTGITL